MRSLSLACLASILLSCASPSADGPVGFDVRWALGEPTALPSEVSDVVIYICYADEDSCDRNQCSIGALTGASMSGGSCRPTEGTEGYEDRPVLVRRDLRTDVPVSFTVVGADETGGYRFIGQAGPLVLGEGQRRQVPLTMYPIGSSVTVNDANVRALMGTVSHLPDGRVLVAGGFSSATEGTCDAGLGLPMGTRCFDLVATDRAYAFDVTTRTVTEIRNRMLEARGGHSATVLPDGRVLLAGGASSATVAFAPIGTADSGRYDLLFFPEDEDGSTALASFELFDAYLDQDPIDLDRDGDPGRGGFLGTAGTPGSPGALNVARFLHAAASVPSSPGRVLLAGGMGGGEQSYEVFDAQKPGGYGVYRGASSLSVPRALPGAVGIDDRVWIVGGRDPLSNDDLADVWTEDPDDPAGTLAPATAETEFPNASTGVTRDEPRFALTRPLAAAVDHGGRALFVGWLGPRCLPMDTAPTFVDTFGTVTEPCNPLGAAMQTSFTIAESGVTTPTDTLPRSYGALAHLWTRPNATDAFTSEPAADVAMTGGISSLTYGAQVGIEVFSGQISSTGEALTVPSLALSHMDRRFLHGSAGVEGGGIVTAGGATFDATRGLTLVTSVEVVFVPAR
ncbi:MAG: hypothetical protein AB7S26_33560 [Sandaracinaceae bacterium]